MESTYPTLSYLEITLSHTSFLHNPSAALLAIFRRQTVVQVHLLDHLCTSDAKVLPDLLRLRLNSASMSLSFVLGVIMGDMLLLLLKCISNAWQWQLAPDDVSAQRRG